MSVCCPECGLEVLGVDSVVPGWRVWSFECRECGRGFNGRGGEVLMERVENRLGMKWWVPVGCMFVCEVLS